MARATKEPKGAGPKPTGRPSTYDKDQADAILLRIANGESLRTICAPETMPPESSFRRWVSEDIDGLLARYAHARDQQADHYAEKLVDEAMTSSDAAIGRLRMDALKWAASKLAPKRYGDKVALTGGSDGDAPLTVVIRKPA
jgi:hypothetical protein